MKVIVLGASGQIGSAIRAALNKDHEVVGTSRKDTAELVQFDPFQDDWASLGQADVIINAIGQIGAARSSGFYKIHVELPERIIAHRKLLGNPRIIQISGLGASAKHTVEFLRTKGIADDLFLQHPDTVVIRPSIVCTPKTMIARKMLMLSNMARVSFGLLPVPKGFLDTRIQPIMIQDLVDAVALLLNDRGQRVVNAVGPDPISFRELIALLAEIRNQKFRFIEIPKPVTDVAVRHFVSRVLPNVINSQQYDLLFEDNTADAEPIELLLGRALLPTRPFFAEQFSAGK